MQFERHGKLGRVERAKAASQSVPHEELLRPLEVGPGHLHDLPEAGGNVGKEPATRQVEIGGGDLPHADEAGEDGVDLDDAESGKEVTRRRWPKGYPPGPFPARRGSV